MRKQNREIAQRSGILDVLEQAQVCRVALNTPEGGPYIVPLNYGYRLDEDGVLTLYFHCANEGRKLDLIRADGRCGFQLDCAHELRQGQTACDFTFYFQSIIGSGDIALVADEDERMRGLDALMRHYGGAGLGYKERALALTTVLKLTANEYCGKRHIPAP